MVQTRMMSRSAQQDWLPWGLSVFVAGCAVFVLVRGVLPARTENAELTQQIARLEQDLSRATQSAIEQRASMEKAREVAPAASAAGSEAPDDGGAMAAAKKEFGTLLEPELSSGLVVMEEREGELVVDFISELFFLPGRSEVSKRGRLLLEDIAASIKRLPASQVYQIGGHTDRGRTESGSQHHPSDWKLSALRAANIARYLEANGSVPGEQLVAAGFSGYRPPLPERANRGRPQNPRVEIVLLKSGR